MLASSLTDTGKEVEQPLVWAVRLNLSTTFKPAIRNNIEFTQFFDIHREASLLIEHAKTKTALKSLHDEVRTVMKPEQVVTNTKSRLQVTFNTREARALVRPKRRATDKYWYSI